MVVNELYYGPVWPDTIEPIKAEASTASISDETIAAALRNIYRRDFNPHDDIEPNLFNAIAKTLGSAATEGFSAGSGSAAAPSLGQDPFLQALRHSTDVFAAFKTHRAQNDMAARLLDSNGNLKPFKQWKEEVLPIASHQCNNWLQTEYNTAVLRARQAAAWQQFQAEKDIFPNLKWLPSTSPNPGEDHRPFWNTILPIDHPFWDRHRPGDRWNCKCDLTSTDEPATPVPATVPDGSPSGNNPQPGLKDNPGKTAEVFSDDHPYYPTDCRHCAFYKPGPKARLQNLFRAQKKDCNHCPYANAHIDQAKGIDKGIRDDLQQLHELTGADFIKKLKEITERKVFKPVPELQHIYSTGGEKEEDYPNLINGAQKAVAHGYTVYILPNPKGLKTGDYILKRERIYKIYDLKTISGKSSAGNRLFDSKGQANRALLNMRTSYNPRKLALNIKDYFADNPDAREVLIFKGKREISVTRDMLNKYFVQDFMKEYNK